MIYCVASPKHMIFHVFSFIACPKSPTQTQPSCYKNIPWVLLLAPRLTLVLQHPPDMHPHHASLYFSGALRWKSISFAKQSGRLPQHRGRNGEWWVAPIPGTMGQSIITPPVNIAASITYCCRPLKALCHGASNKTGSMYICVCVCSHVPVKHVCLFVWARLQRHSSGCPALIKATSACDSVNLVEQKKTFSEGEQLNFLRR